MIPTAPSVALTRQTPAIFRVEDIPNGSAETVNQLLQFNHNNWHIMWDTERGGGLHNHQVHYLLTDFALGASPAQIKEAFRNNESYQRPLSAGDELRQLTINDINFSACLGQYKFYAAWLAYFDKEMATKGWHKVLQENIFARTPRAEDLFGRLFEGLSPNLVLW